ncbi:hypothetical protein WDV91_14010 [Curtobacterium flaccumfaciens pv. flaccumfaciens]
MKKSAWLPAVIAPVVVAGAVAAPMIANAANDPIAGTNPSAAAVIASIAKSSDAQYSGKLSQTSALGLPRTAHRVRRLLARGRRLRRARAAHRVAHRPCLR